MKTNDSKTQKPYLVVVRAGDRSLHPDWLIGAGSETRNWDLIVNYFGDDPDKYRDADCIRIDSKGPKWPALYDLLLNIKDVFSNYRYIWLPDDDLECSCEDINQMFTICEREGFALAQPSLSLNSHISHLITAHNNRFRYRITSFIEVMAPCFDQAAMQQLLPTFNENLSGWGLDGVVWPKLLKDRKIAVIDQIQVRHTRPVGAANYGALAAKGITAFDEMKAIREKYQVQTISYRIWAGMPTGGGELVANRFALISMFSFGLFKSASEIKNWTSGQLLRNYLFFLKQHLLDIRTR